MSKIVVESRMCDQCERVYNEDVPAWMTLSFPNVQSEDDAPEFDFCTYECLENWVNDEDEENEAKSEQETVVPVEVLAALDMQGSKDIPPPFAGPSMTLADAIANGLKPGNPV